MVPNRLARYPFFEEARDAVAERADRLVDVVDDAVLERAQERVEGAIRDGETGGVELDVPDRVELFSYPVARAVVSIIDEHPVTRRYAWAESVTARDRFVDDLTGVEQGHVGFDEIVNEFEMEVQETNEAGKYEMEVGGFLELASGMSDEKWKLVNREVDDGWVRVSRDDILELSREAVRERVADGLPLFVPEEAHEAVAPAVENVRETVADADVTTEIDRVEESEFPPCMETLLAEIREGEHLEHHSRFAITSFLTNIGMDTDEIIETYDVNPGFGEEMTRYQTDHIRGDTGPTEYTCPSCSTMVTYGDCRNKDELCETISHPLGYYRRRLEQLDEEDGGGDGEEGSEKEGDNSDDGNQ